MAIRKTKTNKPRALLFVDYEHWYISMTKMHHQKPNMLAWREEIASRYDIKDIYVFADFSHPNLQPEIFRIREVTNLVIETKNTSGRYMKDFTDFIILDHIYQHAMTDRDVDCYILFTGDGHFSSVVNFLRQKCDKEVGVYGVRLAMSSILRSAASWTVEIPPEEKKQDPDMPYFDLIFAYLTDCERKEDYRAMTLPRVLSTLAEAAGIGEDVLRPATDRLFAMGYISRCEKLTDGNISVSILKADWNRLKIDDFWDEKLFIDE